MTSDKLSSLTRTATPALSVLFVAAAILFAGPFQTATATGLTTTTQEQKIIETQDSATDQLSESDRDVNGIEFTPRWGAPSTIQPNTVTVLFAECLKDEFAVSSMFISETSDIAASQSFPVALPDNSMVWLSVVKNTDTNEARAASVGVICADENNGRGEGNVNLDINTKTIIQNTIKNIINVQNNQITNLVNVVNVYQQITNNAIQILSATGNNNTVNQVISQSAAEIANQNATAPAQINQIIKQNAEQQGVITGGGGNLLNQTIGQNANQGANMTGGLGNTVDQGVDQGASQGANMTGGLGNTVDQFLDQNANQAANVAGEE